MSEYHKNNTANELIEQLKLYNQLGKPIELRNMIANNNLAIVKGALKANGFFSADRLKNSEIEEIEQDGYIALLRAIEDYNPDLNFSFPRISTNI